MEPRSMSVQTFVLDKSVSNNLNIFNTKINELDPTTRHKITIKPFTQTRSELQNALSHAWYSELSLNLKEETATGYKSFCKLHFGVAIMRATDEEFRTVYDLAIKGLSYEKKLEIMKILPVTSLMNTKQLNEYLEAMKDYFYTQCGYDLKFPADY